MVIKYSHFFITFDHFEKYLDFFTDMNFVHEKLHI